MVFVGPPDVGVLLEFAENLWLGDLEAVLHGHWKDMASGGNPVSLEKPLDHLARCQAVACADHHHEQGAEAHAAIQETPDCLQALRLSRDFVPWPQHSWQDVAEVQEVGRHEMSDDVGRRHRLRVLGSYCWGAGCPVATRVGPAGGAFLITNNPTSVLVKTPDRNVQEMDMDIDVFIHIDIDMDIDMNR